MPSRAESAVIAFSRVGLMQPHVQNVASFQRNQTQNKSASIVGKDFEGLNKANPQSNAQNVERMPREIIQSNATSAATMSFEKMACRPLPLETP